jgi:hypothetical protein
MHDLMKQRAMAGASKWFIFWTEAERNWHPQLPSKGAAPSDPTPSHYAPALKGPVPGTAIQRTKFLTHKPLRGHIPYANHSIFHTVFPFPILGLEFRAFNLSHLSALFFPC